MTTALETYKARWADFLTDCDNLDSARRWLANGYVNEGDDWDDACNRVEQFEDRIAHLSVQQRGDLIYHEAIPLQDI